MKNYILITTAMLVAAIISGTYFLYRQAKVLPGCMVSNITTKISEHKYNDQTLGAYHIVAGFQEKIELIYIVPEPVKIDTCGEFNVKPLFGESSDYGYGEEGRHIKSVKVTKTNKLEFTYTEKKAAELPSIQVVWDL